MGTAGEHVLDGRATTTSPGVSTPTRHRLRFSRFTCVDWSAALIVLAQFVVRTRGATRGFWFDDDWTQRFTIATRPFVLSQAFVIYAGHFWPGPNLLFRFVETLAPNSFSTAVVVSGVLQVIGTVLVYCVLRRLFGPRPLVALLLLWFAFTTLTLSSMQWLNVAYYFLPFQIAFAALVLLFLRYVDKPTLLGALGISIGEAIALCWYERAAFIPLVLFALAAWFPISATKPIGARQALSRYRRVWVLLGVALALYVALYSALKAVRFSTPGGPGSLASAHDTLRLTGTMLVAFATSLVGGPWHWTSGSVLVGAAPPPLLAVAALVLIGALIIWTCTARPIARAAWLCLLAYLLIQACFLAYGRLGTYGPDLGRNYRYFADAAIPATLALAFALLPTRHGRNRPPPRAQATKGRLLRNCALVTLGGLLLVSVGISSSTELRAWAANPGRAYVTNATHDFQRVGAAGLLAQTVPAGVLPSFFAPYNTTQVVLSLSPGHPRFEKTVSDDLIAVDTRGHIEPAQIIGWQSLAGPTPGCGWAISAPSTDIPLDGRAFSSTWYVGIRYHASVAARALVRFGRGSQIVPFPQGRHTVFFATTGGGTDIEILGGRPEAGLCIEGTTLGALKVVGTPRR